MLEKAGKAGRGGDYRQGCCTVGREVGSDEKTPKNAARARPDTDVMPAIWGETLGWVSQL